jgi:hypothetical protein
MGHGDGMPQIIYLFDLKHKAVVQDIMQNKMGTTYNLPFKYGADLHINNVKVCGPEKYAVVCFRPTKRFHMNLSEADSFSKNSDRFEELYDRFTTALEASGIKEDARLEAEYLPM